jgi:opacity protein-like surface antigen
MKKTVLAAAGLILLTSVSAFAQAATPRFDQRQANQQQRIDQGVASGQLTGREAARLEKGQEHLQAIEDKATSDGRVTRQERARLQHAEDVQSRHIYREKHDRQHDLNHDGRMDRPARRK